MDPSISQVLKMILQDGTFLAKKAELCKDTRPDLVADIDEFCCSFRSLTERYDHLNAEIYKTMPLEFHMHDASSAPSSPILTPDQKAGVLKTAHQVISVTSAAHSSDLSLKGSSDSSSSLSDSESESFNSSGNVYYSIPVGSEHKGLHQNITDLRNDVPSMDINLQLDIEDDGNTMFNAQEKGNHEELLGRIVAYEEQLRDKKVKLQLLQEEVARLKSELEKRECVAEVAETLQGQLELARRDIRLVEADLEAEKARVMELQTRLTGTTNELQGHLWLAQEEISILKAKLDSEFWQVIDREEKILHYKSDISALENEVKASKLSLLNAEENFLAEKARLQSNISSLSEKETSLEAKVREWELQRKSMEDKVRQHETEKMEGQLVHDTHLIALQGEINQLKMELVDKNRHVEILNKDLDGLKFKYDMLMAEKDGINAAVDKLTADLSSRDNQIGQMEEQLSHISIENLELISGSESVQKMIRELRLRIVELQEEVDKQRDELSAGAEEKREAIRQLCFSLDHYRSGYKELSQALHLHNRLWLLTV